MAVRGCVTLLFILLSGIVLAEELATSPLPALQELHTSKITSGTSSPTDSKPSSPTKSTTETPTTPHHTTTKSTTEPPTSHHATTKSTTEPPTSHHTTTKSTTEPPTSHHTTTKSTTEPPTTPHHNITNSTTEAPTTPHHNITNSTTEAPTTMHHNITNSTTEAPTTMHTNATTAPPPTSPPVPNPTVGNYSVKSDNVTVCLMAKMGLQFSFKMSENSSFQTLNLDPSANVTEVSGTCGRGGSDSSLLLKSEEITVQFVFTNVSQKFRLHALTLTVNIGNGNVFNYSNNNLSLWEASVGSSYMCRKEQSYNITDKLTLHTFELQVQPFAIQNNKFNTAEDCVADEPDNFIVPIAVGVALAVLVIIVLLAYLIGRKRSQMSGYEQFDS